MTRTLRALALAAILLPAAAWAQSLTRGPYLQTGAADSMVVAWRTSVATDGVVHYGTSPQSLAQSATDGGSRTQHEVRITGLQPDTLYYYDVGTAAGALAGGDANHFFRTAPAAGPARRLRAWIVGDDGTGASRQAQVQSAALAWAGAYPPDLFLHMGDMAYSDGTESEFTSNFFAPHQPVLRNTVVWPTMGNHEGRSADSATETGPYYDAYVLPRAGEAGGLPSGTEAYYSFDWANVHFVVLDSHDSDRSPGGAMLTWLDQDLAATNQEWLVAFWHHPPYTKGSHDSDTEGQLVDMRENALPILEAHGVDLVLAGHSHIYERSFLLDGAYDTPTTAAGHVVDGGDGRVDGTGPYRKRAGQNANDGAVYVVAGHGGAGLGQSGVHPVMFFTEMVHGSTFLDLDRNTFQVTNVRYDGVASDRFAMIKGAGFILGAPNGGEQLPAGGRTTIRWATGGQVPDVKLEWSGDAGATWQPIAASTPNTGTHDWTLPSATTSRALVRVSDPNAAATFDTSDATFSIGAAAPVTYVAFGDVWRYHDQDVDPGPDWADPTYDDSTWPTGNGQLGYGDGDEATSLLNADPNVPTVYFRRVVNVPGDVTAASFRVTHDDGVAVFVNGTQVFEKYVGNGLAHPAYASQTSSDDELSTGTIPVLAGPFVPGDNVIAAMVKQANATSSDLSFDLELTLTVDRPVQNAAPVLEPIADATIAEGQALAFQLSASDGNGDVLAYGATDLPAGAALDGATGAFAWTPGFDQAGTYRPTFTVSDGIDQASQAMTITVTDVTSGPPALQPIGDRVVEVGQELAFVVAASDPDGEPVTLTTEGAPPGSTFDPATGAFSWSPVDADVGEHPVGFVATAAGESDREDILVTVVPAGTGGSGGGGTGGTGGGTGGTGGGTGGTGGGSGGTGGGSGGTGGGTGGAGAAGGSGGAGGGPGGEGPGDGSGDGSGASSGGCGCASGAGEALPLLGFGLGFLVTRLRRRRQPRRPS